MKYDPNQIFNFIVNHKRVNDGLSPTIREIKKGIGIASNSTVSHHLRKLEEAGKIKLTQTGQIKVVGAMWLYPSRIPTQ